MDNVFLFLQDPYQLSIEQLTDLGKKADLAYFNTDKPILTDKQYDLLKSIILDKDPNNPYLLNVGAPIMTKEKIKLPYCLGSAFKPKAAKIIHFIENFKQKYSGPYIISEKLDGVSALLHVDNNMKKLMTKGDSVYGRDISNLIPGLIPNISDKSDKSYYIRGEIIMTKKKFKKYEKLKKNVRNTVSGFVNGKHVDKGIKDCDFVGYELIKPWLPFDQQMKTINNFKFKTAKYELVDDFDLEYLLQKYKEYVDNSEYECDGIIISYNLAKRENIKIPKYMFAFKSLDDLETALVIIKKIIWNISKDGYIIPVITFNPVSLNGVEIKRVTSFNAKYIYDNSLGPGAIIEIVRSGGVIPYIKNIIKSVKKPQMPTDIDWTWNITNVNIITTEYSEEQKAKEIAKFFSDIGVENIALSNVKKLIDANLDTIPKIFKITKKHLLNVANFKEKMVEKIYNSIQKSIENLTLPKFIFASNVCGHGFGPKLINKIFKKYPDIIFKYIEMNSNDFRDLLLNIDSFANERTEQFIESIEPLLELISSLPDALQDKLIIEVYNPDKNQDEIKIDLTGKKFVFSGPRNKDYEKFITDNNGEISSSVTSKTFAVISTKEEIDNGTNRKIITAKELPNCLLLSWEDFEEQFLK